MDRPIVYVGEIPRAEDFLGLAKDALYALAYMASATIGSATGVAGLGISPTGPASMSVVIGTGSIYQLTPVDSAAYGVLGTDSNVIFKQGLLEAPVTLTLSAPVTSGYSQNYLVQVDYSDVDGGNIVPPYFNSAQPTLPWNGAGGLGGSQNTIRFGSLVVQLLPGVAAPTGSQATPPPSAGFTGIWIITVPNGATSITSANWTRSSATVNDPFSAPWFPNLEGLDSRYQRILPASMTTFHVNNTSPVASDSNPGTTAFPFLTIQGCINYVQQFQSAFIINVIVSAGTYTIPAHNGAANVGAGPIAGWQFTGAGVGSTIINASALGCRGFLSFGNPMSISGFTISSYYEAVSAQSGGVITINGPCSFTGAPHAGTIVSYFGALVGVEANVTFSGTHLQPFVAVPGSMYVAYADVNQTTSVLITFSGCTVTNAVFVAAQGGGIDFYASQVTFSGTPTGARYIAELGGSILTTTGNINYIPGTAPGNSATGYYN